MVTALVVSSIPNITVFQLERALELKRQIAALEAEVQELLGSSARVRRGRLSGRPRRRMSEAGKRRIAAAQRARWARHNRTTGANSKPKTKRRMSATARARIAAAQRRRWAAVKAAKS